MVAPFISTIVRRCLPLLLATFIADLLIVQVTVGGDGIRTLAPAPKGTLKTIKAEDGDVIDCVDIYKQPSLDHPQLKNHKIQMKPSSYPTGWNPANDASRNIQQSWSRNEKCPNGSIPIRRPFKDVTSLSYFREKFRSRSLNSSNTLSNTLNEKYAGITLDHRPWDIYGITAAIGLNSPHVEPADLSFTRIGMGFFDGGVYAEAGGVGWMVNPGYYQDSHTRFTIYFQNETIKYMCFNFDCPGFIQVAHEVALGAVITPVSTYNGTQYEMPTMLYCSRDPDTDKLWVRVANLDIGYWPSEVLPTITDGTGNAYWEGLVVEGKSSTHPTTTHMGSGEPPEEGYGKAALIHGINYVLEEEDGHKLVVPESNSTRYKVTNKGCYWTSRFNINEDGGYFFYGGPGHSYKCYNS